VGLGVGWRTISLGYGLLATALALAVLVLLLRAGAGGAPDGDAAPGVNGAPRIGWGVRNQRAFVGLVTINFLDSMVQSGFGTFIAFLMIERGVALDLAALAVVLTLAGGVVGKFCCGFLARRMGVVPSLVLVQALTVAMIGAVALAPVGIAYALLPLTGIFLQGSSSIIYATVTDIFHGSRQARGFSLIYTSSNLSSVAAALTFGVLSDAASVQSPVLVMAALTAVTLPRCPVLRRGLDAIAD